MPSILRTFRDVMYWNTIAPAYDSFMLGEFGSFYRVFAQHITESVPPHSLLLDAGCGTGITTLAAASRAQRVVALDISPTMLSRAREKIARHGYENVTFQRGDLYHLPFSAATFDCVVCGNTLHMVDEPPRVLNELFRVLKPSGFFIAGVFCYGEHDREWQRAWAHIFSLLSRIHLCVPVYRFTKQTFRSLLLPYGTILTEKTLSHKPCFVFFVVKKSPSSLP